MDRVDVEDILNDSLEFLGEEGADPAEDRVIRYGPLVLTVAPKEGKANTLLADHLFSPALLLAEQIERGRIELAGKSVVELGAGCALPSLLLSTLSGRQGPRLVVPTDFPDPVILDNLKSNVERNAHLVAPGCKVVCMGHAWGDEGGVKELRGISTTDVQGFDAVIISDLLHFDASHDVLLQSVTGLLSRAPDARVYCAAGKYTPEAVCDAWLGLSRDAGLVWEEQTDDNGAAWAGEMGVVWEGKEMPASELAVRKGMCRMWIGRWDAKEC